jgi:hypothetical protein
MVNDERQLVRPLWELAQRIDAIFAPKGLNISAQGQGTASPTSVAAALGRVPMVPSALQGRNRR